MDITPAVLSPLVEKIERLPAAGRRVPVALAMGLYCLVFLALHPILGNSAAAFSVLPVALAAWLCSTRLGIFTTLLVLPLNLLLLHMTGHTQPLLSSISNNLPGTVALTVVSLLIGHASGLSRRLRKELEARQQAETALETSDERLHTQAQQLEQRIKELHCLYNISNLLQKKDLSLAEILQSTVDLIPAAMHDPQRAMARILYETNEFCSAGFEETAHQFNQAILVNDQPAALLQICVRPAGPPAHQSPHFSDEERDLAKAIANRIGKTIETLLLRQAEHDQRVLAEALRDTAALLTSTLSLEEVLDRILTNVSRVVPHDAANVMLVDESQGITRAVRGQGYAHRMPDGRTLDDVLLPRHIDLVPGYRWMVTTRQPLVVSDVLFDPDWVVIPQTEWIRSYIGAPIIVKDQVIGFLNLDSETTNFFQPEHGSRLQSFANQAGIALQNARLHTETEHLAVTDGLTGVYNRYGLMMMSKREVERALRYNRPLATLMLDVDHFKAFNDRYSYQVGDSVLSGLIGRVRSCIREIDVIGRYGGDEFIIILAECDRPVAHQIAVRIQQKVTATLFNTPMGDLPVTISIGIAVLSPDASTLEALLAQAGEAIHHAKRNGGNCIAHIPAET